MRKHAVLLTLALFEVLAIALFGLFWFSMRKDLLAMYGAGPMEHLPRFVELALAGGLIPGVVAAGAGIALLGLLPRVHARMRVVLAATGLVVTVFALSYAMAVGSMIAFSELRPG